MNNPTFRAWRRCEECDGNGWYAQQVDDAANAEQVQCNGCDGFGYIDQPDAPITPEALQAEALQAEGWEAEGSGETEGKLFHRGFVGVSFLSGAPKVEVYMAGACLMRPAPNCRTMSDLRALVAMLGGAD